MEMLYAYIGKHMLTHLLAYVHICTYVHIYFVAMNRLFLIFFFGLFYSLSSKISQAMGHWLWYTHRTRIYLER